MAVGMGVDRFSIEATNPNMDPPPKPAVIAGIWARDTRRKWGAGESVSRGRCAAGVALKRGHGGAGVGGRGTCTSDTQCVMLSLLQAALIAFTAGTVIWAVLLNPSRFCLPLLCRAEPPPGRGADTMDGER
jgi:hypothetical protein